MLFVDPQRHVDIYEPSMSFDTVFDVEFVEILPLGADRNFAELEAVGHDRPDGRYPSLEIAHERPRAAVAGNLLVMIASYSDP